MVVPGTDSADADHCGRAASRVRRGKIGRRHPDYRPMTGHARSSRSCRRLLPTLVGKNIFGIDTKLPLDKTILKNNIDKYSEPVIDEAFEKIDKGYSSNNNDSLDRLFNIENDD